MSDSDGVKRAAVIGAGMIGRVLAGDMAQRGFSVTILDPVGERLESAAEAARHAAPNATIDTCVIDATDPSAIADALGTQDVALGAASSAVGLRVLERVIAAGVPYCDVSFMPQDARDLNDAAQRAGVTAVVDMGVAPGMSNLLAAEGARRLDRVDEIDICVGGLPVDRSGPFEYKAAFSPWDVIEEYTRPARFLEKGEAVVHVALSGVEESEFEGVGVLEAFNTDGLRSLLDPPLAPTMRERTLRYPGHAELMTKFRAAGLFELEPVSVHDAEGKPASVRPRDVLARVLFPAWTYEPGEADLTVMRIVVRGQENGAPKTYQWDLLDHYDTGAQQTSMARTTGFPCTAVAAMLAEGVIREPGVLAPERLAAMPGVVDRVLAELGERGVRYRESSPA